MGIQYSDILAKALRLHKLGKMQIKLHSYHNCEDGTHQLINVSDFGKGFPILPDVCPHCLKIIIDHNELRFNFAIARDGEFELIPFGESELATFNDKHFGWGD